MTFRGNSGRLYPPHRPHRARRHEGIDHLAARQDGEAIANPKLIGHKIPRSGQQEPAEQAEAFCGGCARKPRHAKPLLRANAIPTKKRRQTTKGAETRGPAEPEPERSPVVEDIEGEWNGPLPSFLSVSAD